VPLPRRRNRGIESGPDGDLEVTEAWPVEKGVVILTCGGPISPASFLWLRRRGSQLCRDEVPTKGCRQSSTNQ
jgi:hypothetical protein